MVLVRLDWQRIVSCRRRIGDIGASDIEEPLPLEFRESAAGVAMILKRRPEEDRRVRAVDLSLTWPVTGPAEDFSCGASLRDSGTMVTRDFQGGSDGRKFGATCAGPPLQP